MSSVSATTFGFEEDMFFDNRIDLRQFPHLMTFNGLAGIFMVKQDIAFFAFIGFRWDGLSILSGDELGRAFP